MLKYNIMLLIVILMAAGCDNKKGNKMNISEHPQLKEFKKDINYDQAIKDIERQKGIVVDWSNQLLLEIDINPLFKVLHDSVKILGPNIISHEWILGVDKPEIEIEIIVSSDGPETTGSQLLAIASNTTMSNIPYQKGPAELGHLSIWDSDTEPRSIAWVFYNICFHLQKYEKHTDLLEITKWLQKYAEKNIVQNTTSHLPRIEKINLSSPKIKVGETAKVSVQLAPDQDSERFILEMGEKSDNLGLVLEEGLSLDFEALEVGQGQVELILADKKNLLCTSNIVEIEVISSD